MFLYFFSGFISGSSVYFVQVRSKAIGKIHDECDISPVIIQLIIIQQ